jgi:pimeloyl-ACP methyl ester carboxylesterase
MTQTIMRTAEWSNPIRPVRREVLVATPETDDGRPPLLFVPDFGHGAWAFGEHWLEYAATRGFAAHAVSLRGHGRSEPDRKATLRAYSHDVAQVAASLPRRAVLIGHGAGALAVAHALARYPARAGILLSPIMRNRNPLSALGSGKPSARKLFSRELPAAAARTYAARVTAASKRARWGLVRGHDPERPVGNPPMLIGGSPDDALVPVAALRQTAKHYGGAPLLFPGMGHDLMLDARWREPIDAILDWLEKLP